jgi:hypothetical protein
MGKVRKADSAPRPSVLPLDQPVAGPERPLRCPLPGASVPLVHEQAVGPLTGSCERYSKGIDLHPPEVPSEVPHGGTVRDRSCVLTRCISYPAEIYGHLDVVVFSDSDGIYYCIHAGAYRRLCFVGGVYADRVNHILIGLLVLVARSPPLESDGSENLWQPRTTPT